MVRKDLAIASLEVDPKEGKLWLNTSRCILRITNLQFTGEIKEQFDMLEINGSEGYMVSDAMPVDESDDLMTFLMNTANFLQSEINHNKHILDKGAFLDRMLTTMRQLVDTDYRDEGSDDGNIRATVVRD